MNKFSIEILEEKVKLYKCSREEYKNILLKYKLYNTDDILCHTQLKDEITLYHIVNIVNNQEENNERSESLKTNNHILSKLCISDHRIYNVINIYEDIPGIDHVGIIHNISKLFLEKNIPILYINTYGHNIILVSEENMYVAIDSLKKIGNI
jgi:hypothetical protein